MDDTHALPQRIHRALARGWTVLTANQRAARTLRHAFDLHHRALGIANWQPPAIHAWDTWLGSLWHRLLLEGHVSELLLNPTQEHTLWHDLIAADGAEGGSTLSLRPIDALAETAAGAWLLLHAYRGRRRLHASTCNADTRAFERWAGEFERRCARSHLLSAAQLPEALRAAVADGRLTLQPGLLLVGFDHKTPAQAALLDAIAATGATVDELLPGSKHIQTGSSETDPSRALLLAAAPDEHQEITAAAHWLRARLTERPTSRLAVIVPALDADRAEIDRVFREILAPELNDIAAPSGSGPWEFSLGLPLARTPMVATALELLRWAAGPLPLDRITALLLSPHFAADRAEPSRAGAGAADLPESSPEHLARAEFDAFVLRQQPLLRPELSIDRVLTLASNPNPNSSRELPLLIHHLRNLRALFNKKDLATGERTHADWAAIIHELLDNAGWAACNRDNSTEFQNRRKWESALDELATLDFDGKRVNFAGAVSALERIAAETLFAPESRHAPIQIMGPLESAGSAFDAIWFVRASDLTWPSTSAPNPLLGWPLQRELGMPGADPERDTAHARRVTERIAASAPFVVFSYAQESTDGRQRASPLLTRPAPAGLNLEPRSASGIVPPDPAPAPVEIEAIADDTPIPPPPDRVLQGGAAVLGLQAACGFRAFAEKRLFASALDARSLGLDPGERGSLVHKVLERFWAQVETQAALRRLTIAERDALLARSIDDALARHVASLAPGWSRAYLDTERQRLLNLLRPWLDYEANIRLPFTVKSREQKLGDVGIGPLRLDIRVDRIDLACGEGDTAEPAGEIILDYKTGPAKPADWLGERPDAPQLPLYAVVSESPQLAAIAFAGLRPGKEMGLRGYEAHDGVLPKATRLSPETESLEAQVDNWRKVLTSLARDFHSGDARVSPKQYPTTCRYCQQRLLCRLNVSALDTDARDDSDFDSDSNPGPDPFNLSNTEADSG